MEIRSGSWPTSQQMFNNGLTEHFNPFVIPYRSIQFAKNIPTSLLIIGPGVRTSQISKINKTMSGDEVSELENRVIESKWSTPSFSI